MSASHKTFTFHWLTGLWPSFTWRNPHNHTQSVMALMWCLFLCITTAAIWFQFSLLTAFQCNQLNIYKRATLLKDTAIPYSSMWCFVHDLTSKAGTYRNMHAGWISDVNSFISSSIKFPACLFYACRHHQRYANGFLCSGIFLAFCGFCTPSTDINYTMS